MKFTFVKSEEKQEIIAYAREKDQLIDTIEDLCNKSEDILIGWLR